MNAIDMINRELDVLAGYDYWLVEPLEGDVLLDADGIERYLGGAEEVVVDHDAKRVSVMYY